LRTRVWLGKKGGGGGLGTKVGLGHRGRAGGLGNKGGGGGAREKGTRNLHLRKFAPALAQGCAWS